MNREDIIRMAHESHLDVYGLGKDYAKFADAIERFAALVASAEREAIYNIVMEAPFKEQIETEPDYENLLFAMKAMAFSITSAIRARGQA